MPAMRPPVFAARRPLPTARGFALPELIVALALLSVGALAIVGASAAAIRSVGEAESQSAATAAARTRVEQLASAGCSAFRNTAGADSAGPLREWWKVTVSRNGTRLIVDSVQYLERGVAREVVARRLHVC